MQHNTPTRREKGKIYVKNIRKNSCRIGNRIRLRIRNQVESRIRIRKIIPDPQHWLLFLVTGMVLLRVRHTLWVGQVFSGKNIVHKSVFGTFMGTQ